jgi:transcriptional regulator with GAF, ATPase, and Fis domain
MWPDSPPRPGSSAVALWRSPEEKEAGEITRRAAGVDVTVLICGETEGGIVARTIHHLSSGGQAVRQGQLRSHAA